MSSCQRCSQTHDHPGAFLLTCRGCRKAWHHRCLMPPMEDKDLIQLIRATNEGDTANDLSSWTCRRCRKRTPETTSTMSSREPTASFEGSKSLRPSNSPAVSEVNVSRPSILTADVRVKQESNNVADARRADGQERSEESDSRGSTAAASVKRSFSAKGTKSSTPNQPRPGPTQPRDADVQMVDVTFTPREKNRFQRLSFPTHSHPVKAARKLGNAALTMSSEDDAEMQVDSPPFSESASRVAQASSSGNQANVSKSVAEPLLLPVRTEGSNEEQLQEVRPAVGAAIQSQVNQVATDEIDDDPEDLYGPPVERRIIRILPSLAEELRQQQQRVAAEKEKRRAPLATDWIIARHVNDPLWKEIPTEGRRRRKGIARKLGDNGLNVSELTSYFTVENWIREHK